jgi:DNA-binding LacI/PurR family transcriptional regulator
MTNSATARTPLEKDRHRPASQDRRAPYRPRGRQAGTDITPVGFDDLTICQFTQPALTTIRFSPGEIARLAFKALLEKIERVKTKTSFEYMTRFKLRESACSPKE